MLQAIAIYLLKTIIVSSVLLLYYWFALRNKRFHYYNRFYLLSAVVLSIVLPLLNLNLFTLWSSSDKAITMFNVMYADGETELAFANTSASLDWQQILCLVVLIITILLLLKIVFSIANIYHVKKKYPVTNMQGFDFVNTDLQQAPFSFLKNIFWRSDISLEERTGRMILQHELAHIKQKHTWDKLFMQVVAAVLWANPLYRLIQKELYLIHEFIADDKSVTDSNTAAFAEMLLHTYYSKFNFSPAQPFFYSPIKRRLIMLSTSKEPRFSYLRRMMALPLLACVVLLFAFRLQKESNETVTTLKPGTAFKLIVDAGHGGEDNGAIGNDGTKEKDITLTISKKIKALASEYGIEVAMVRENDVYINPKEKTDFSNAQTADAFISIHVNKVAPVILKETNSKVVVNAEGVDIYVSPDNVKFNESKILGSAIIQRLGTDFKVNTPLQVSRVGIWVLKANTKPSVLIECGYLNNQKDLANLKDDAKVEQMARKILEGVVAYANNKSTPVVPYDVKLQDANAMADTTNPNSNQNKNNQTNTNNNKNTSKNKILPSDLEYVVNGEIKTKEEVDKISSNNIATMQVLKDNDFAKSIYNVKGKQAVIIITTKDYKPEIVIRSATENIPLYIVDGTAMSAEEAKKIDPNNIFSVNVLKGDDAIKAYGEKGKYGVVEITTKGVTKKGNGIMINTGFEAQKIVLLAKPKEKC